MIGCLSLLFRLTGFFVILLALAGVWLYRDRIVDEAERLAGRAPARSTGVPGPAALAAAREKVARLRAGRDSVVLGPDESAAVLVAGLPAALRDRLDSVTVGLGTGRVDLSGLVQTGRLPVDLVGPLSIVLRERERVTLGGAVSADGGRARVAVDQFAVRSIPLPRDAVPRVVARALGEDAAGAVTIELPPGVSGVRVQPEGIILYRGARP